MFDVHNHNLTWFSYLGIYFLFNRDYRGLKVHLGVIRAQALEQVDTPSYFGKTGADRIHHSTPDIEVENDESEGEYCCTPFLSLNMNWTRSQS